jgi:hypothetical protein
VVLLNFRFRGVGKAPTERSGLAKRRHPYARVGIPALEKCAKLLSALGPEHTQMAFAGDIKSGMDEGCSSQRKRDGGAQTQAAGVAATPHDRPARAGSKGSDPQRGAYRIDDEQYEDDPEASERRPGKVGRIQPSSAIWQAGQQQRYADAALGKGPDEGDRRDRQGHHHVICGDHQRHTQESNHCAGTGDREPRCVRCEFRSHPFGSVAGRFVVDFHRAARKPEHGE